MMPFIPVEDSNPRNPISAVVCPNAFVARNYAETATNLKPTLNRPNTTASGSRQTAIHSQAMQT
jgi:hypothetical protein